jgi:hypothetical protein
VTFLPPRIKRASGKKDVGKRSPAHRAWVRGHACCACGSQTAIEAAHVRVGTDGGIGMKPSDRWVISLCKEHHTEQHQIGEPAFERRYGIDMRRLAEAFFRASPHRHKLEQSNG